MNYLVNLSMLYFVIAVPAEKEGKVSTTLEESRRNRGRYLKVPDLESIEELPDLEDLMEKEYMGYKINSISNEPVEELTAVEENYSSDNGEVGLEKYYSACDDEENLENYSFDYDKSLTTSEGEIMKRPALIELPTNKNINYTNNISNDRNGLILHTSILNGRNIDCLKLKSILLSHKHYLRSKCSNILV